VEPCLGYGRIRKGDYVVCLYVDDTLIDGQISEFEQSVIAPKIFFVLQKAVIL
jgi:hypothetical protein